MRHDAAKGPFVMVLNIVHLSRLVHVHDPLVPPFVVVRDAPVVGAVSDEGVFVPVVVAIRTTGQEIQRLSVRVCGECVGEAAVGVLLALFAAELRRGGLLEEDTVLSGEVDVVSGILLISCGLSDPCIVDGCVSVDWLRLTAREGSCGKLEECHGDHRRIVSFFELGLRECVDGSEEQDEACSY